MFGPEIIPTERENVVLRELFTEADDEAYFEAVQASIDHLKEFEYGTVVKYQTIDDVRHARLYPPNPEKLRTGIWDGDTFVGTAGLTPCGIHKKEAEIGYWLDVRHTGKGYATLAVRALVRYGWGHYDRFYATVVHGNVASERVLERAGFIETAKEAGQTIFDLDPTKWLAAQTR